MSHTEAITMTWNGKQLVPANDFWARRAAKEFAPGHTYHMADQPERSTNSHRHYFSLVNELWQNLPEALAEEFPSDEHLRKYALIKAGYFNSHSVPCPSQEDARKFAAFIQPVDEFAVIDIRDTVVTIYRAKSQRYKAMGKEMFQKSKDDVLGVISQLIGISRDQAQQGGRAA